MKSDNAMRQQLGCRHCQGGSGNCRDRNWRGAGGVENIRMEGGACAGLVASRGESYARLVEESPVVCEGASGARGGVSPPHALRIRQAHAQASSAVHR